MAYSYRTKRRPVKRRRLSRNKGKAPSTRTKKKFTISTASDAFNRGYRMAERAYDAGISSFGAAVKRAPAGMFSGPTSKTGAAANFRAGFKTMWQALTGHRDLHSSTATDYRFNPKKRKPAKRKVVRRTKRNRGLPPRSARTGRFLKVKRNKGRSTRTAASKKRRPAGRIVQVPYGFGKTSNRQKPYYWAPTPRAIKHHASLQGLKKAAKDYHEGKQVVLVQTPKSAYELMRANPKKRALRRRRK